MNETRWVVEYSEPKFRTKAVCKPDINEEELIKYVTEYMKEQIEKEIEILYYQASYDEETDDYIPVSNFTSLPKA